MLLRIRAEIIYLSLRAGFTNPPPLLRPPATLSCHLAYFIAVPDSTLPSPPEAPVIQRRTAQRQRACSAQLFIVAGLSGSSISIIESRGKVTASLCSRSHHAVLLLPLLLPPRTVSGARCCAARSGSSAGGLVPFLKIFFSMSAELWTCTLTCTH